MTPLELMEQPVKVKTKPVVEELSPLEQCYNAIEGHRCRPKTGRPLSLSEEAEKQKELDLFLISRGFTREAVNRAYDCVVDYEAASEAICKDL